MIRFFSFFERRLVLEGLFCWGSVNLLLVWECIFFLEKKVRLGNMQPAGEIGWSKRAAV